MARHRYDPRTRKSERGVRHICWHPSTEKFKYDRAKGKGGGEAKEEKERREEKHVNDTRNVTYRHLRNINIYEPLPANQGMNAPALLLRVLALLRAARDGTATRPFVNTRVAISFFFPLSFFRKRGRNVCSSRVE